MCWLLSHAVCAQSVTRDTAIVSTRNWVINCPCFSLKDHIVQQTFKILKHSGNDTWAPAVRCSMHCLHTLYFKIPYTAPVCLREIGGLWYKRCWSFRYRCQGGSQPFKARSLRYISPVLTFTNPTFCPHSVFMGFVWIWEQITIISLCSINWLVFITDTESVYCAVRTESLYIIQVVFCVVLRTNSDHFSIQH